LFIKPALKNTAPSFYINVPCTLSGINKQFYINVVVDSIVTSPN